MLVTDKQADIAILRTLGMTSTHIMIIFVVQGVVIGLLGTIIGISGGVALALHLETIIAAIEQWIGHQFLAADIYYISHLPSELVWQDVGTIGIMAFFLSLLSTLYPAWRASKTKPAEALRYD